MGNGDIQGADAMVSDNNDALDEDEDKGGEYDVVVNDSSRMSTGEKEEHVVIDFERE